jgi:hypothetical protein
LVKAVRCTSCHRNVAAGVEAQKMIVEYRQSDGSSRLFGYMMADGALTAATGQMVKGWHHKCFWIAKKREARGGTVTGRVMAGGPTGYDIGQMALSKDDVAALGITEVEALQRGTGQLSARLDGLRELAESMGKGVGDAQVQEAFGAAEHGGPYVHHHEHRLDTYQLLAHLNFAHGVDAETDAAVRGLQDQHLNLHAKAALDQLVQQRQEDGDAELPVRDWRDQHTVEM